MWLLLSVCEGLSGVPHEATTLLHWVGASVVVVRLAGESLLILGGV